ncbi:MAG: SDR family oxidoreductase [Candidatus Methanoperedens sp.]
MGKILAQIPLGRLGKPSEVAGAVSYLVSEYGDYITGQVIDINGGLYI